MKIAYILLAHKNPAQLGRLVARLNDRPCEIFLHVDRAVSRETHLEIQSRMRAFSNVHFLPRYRTNWGSFRLVLATLAGIRAVLHSAPECEYAILLSGQDYPVRPTAELYNLLEEQPGISFIELQAFPVPWWNDDGGYKRIQQWHFNLPLAHPGLHRLAKRVLNRVCNTLAPHRRFPGGFTPFGGGQWWCLHRDCLELIDRFCLENIRFSGFFRFVRVSDEIFFHTILGNSPLRQRIRAQMLTYVDWNGPPYPRILTYADLPAIQASGCYFARKLDMSTDPTIFSRLDELLNQAHAHSLPL